MILNFENWKTVNEAQSIVTEAAGISSAIKNHLEEFMKEHGSNATFAAAHKYIASKVEGWDLSKEDYKEVQDSMLKEAKKDEFEESDEEAEDEDDAEFDEDEDEDTEA